MGPEGFFQQTEPRQNGTTVRPPPRSVRTMSAAEQVEAEQVQTRRQSDNCHEYR